MTAVASVAWFGLAAVSSAPAEATPQVVFRSPLPGARWVHPETSLLLRFDPALDAANPPAFTVTGTRSGAHAGRTIVADGGHALIFRPAVPFAYDERVTVDVSMTGAAPGACVAPYSFATSLRRATLPEGAQLPEAFLEDPASRAFAQASLSPLLQPGAGTGDTPFALPAPTQHALDGPATGYYFAAPFSLDGTKAPALLIEDELGSTIFYRQMPASCFDFKMQPDGRMTYFDSYKWMFVALDRSYAPIDSFVCGNGVTTDVHELRLLPNGHALLLGQESEIVDMSQVVPGGDPNASVLGNVIQELDENKNVVFEWRTFDHFQITDATHEDLTASLIDDVHSNALELDNDGNILLSSRHLDEVTKIDHTTGDILWRLGGKNNQFTLVGDSIWFSHQHAIRRIANGDVTLFDNGNYHAPPRSRGVEYALDEVAKTATLVWQYNDTPPTFSFAMGYVERLADGSTLIGYGTGDPDAIQVTSAGTVAKILDLGPSLVSYRTLLNTFPALIGVGTAPGPARLALSNAVPNPFHEHTSVVVTLAHPSPLSLEVFDVRGRRVFSALDPTPRGAGTYRLPVDLASAPAGVYFARVATNQGTASRRLVHLE